MPPNRKVVLKRRRRPDRKALLTFAGLFTVIRIEQMLAEQSPANEVGRAVRASGSPPARQRGYGRRGRICVTRPALVLAGRSGWGAFASSTQLTGASNNPCGWGPSPPPQCTTPGPCGCRGLARAGTKSALPGNDPREWPERRRDGVVVAGKILRHSLRQKRACLVFSPARVRRPDAACGSVVARDGR